MVTFPALHPRLRAVTLDSAELQAQKTYFVWLPSGYTGRGPRYPVVYLFRGHEQEWLNPDEDHSRGGRAVQNIADDLESRGAIGPMLLVMPGLTSDDNLVNSAATDLLLPETGSPGVGTGRFESFLVRELIPHVEAHFHASSRRGADGFSMGGFMAVKLALRHPGLFASVGAYEGAFLYKDGLQWVGGFWPWRRDRFLNYPIFTPAFGLPRNMDYFVRHNPANLAEQAPPDLVRSIQWLIHCGDARLGPEVNFERTQHLLQILRRKGGINQFGDGQLTGHRHNWRGADEHLIRALPLHWQALAEG